MLPRQTKHSRTIAGFCVAPLRSRFHASARYSNENTVLRFGAVLREIDVTGTPLAAYAAVAHLAPSVAELRSRAAALVPALRGRTVWMVNSSAQGGGVAEMLPQVVTLLRE